MISFSAGELPSPIISLIRLSVHHVFLNQVTHLSQTFSDNFPSYLGRILHAGWWVYFDKPHSIPFINHKVVSKKLESIFSRNNILSYTFHGLYADLFYLRMDLLNEEISLPCYFRNLLFKLIMTPHVLLYIILSINIRDTLSHGVIGQMNFPILKILWIVNFCTKTNINLLVNPYS